MTKLVSVIIPTLNEEHDIEDLFVSLKKQTYKKIEVIVVDGGSTDDTVKIARKYTKKVFMIPKAGVTVSRNYGARKARGEIFQFMDADAVLLDKNYFKKVVEAFQKYDVDIVVNRTDAVPPTNIIGRAQLAYRKKTWEYKQKSVVFNAGLPDVAFSCYLKKSFWKIGGYNENLIGNDEIDLARRSMQNNFKTVFAPNIVIYHKDPYTFSQIKRQAIWYGRVIHQESLIQQFKTLSYLSLFMIFYAIFLFSLIIKEYLLFTIINIIFFIPVAYLWRVSRDFFGSAFLLYVLNPFRAIHFWVGYIKHRRGLSKLG